MMRFKTVLLTLLLLALMTTPTLAQTPLAPVGGLQTTDETANPNANISWPPPVYVLRGAFDIRGSANLPSMSNYFIEFRPAEEGLGVSQEEALWFPVSLPSTTAVQNDVLATWDTTQVPDGIYELRLTVNVAGDDEPVQAFVRPIRVENNPPPFAQTQVPPTQQSPLIPTLTLPPVIPTRTLPPPPTATQDLTPRATISVANANVREGDTTFHRVIRSFSQGTEFVIVAISGNRTGWYQVELPTGGLGWVAPSVINVSGNLNNLPTRFPPPPPVTPTPLPTNTPVPTATPVTQANLVAGLVILSPESPRCEETFNVGFDVANLGSGTSASSGVVLLQDTFGGAVQETTLGGFPVLNPGQTFRVQMPITVDTNFGQDHTLVLIIDPNNQIPETNKGDNTQTLTYRLRAGDCD